MITVCKERFFVAARQHGQDDFGAPEDLSLHARRHGLPVREVQANIRKTCKSARRVMGFDPHEPLQVQVNGQQVLVQPICFVKESAALGNVHHLENIFIKNRLTVVYLHGNFYFHGESMATFLGLGGDARQAVMENVAEGNRYEVHTLLANLGISGTAAARLLAFFGPNALLLNRQGFNTWLMAERERPAAASLLSLALEHFQEQQLEAARLAIAGMDRTYVQTRADTFGLNTALKSVLPGLFPHVGRALNEGLTTRKNNAAIYELAGLPDFTNQHQALPMVLKGPLMTLYKAGREVLIALLISNPAASKEEVWAMCRQVVDALCLFARAMRLDDNAELCKYLETDAAYVRERHNVIQNMIKTGAYVPSREDTELARNLLAAYHILPAAPAAPAAIAAPPAVAAAPGDEVAA